jgi:hypothetical protein
MDGFEDYPWSSYNTIIQKNTTNLNRDGILELFEGRKNFIEVHRYTYKRLKGLPEWFLEE